MNHVGDKHAVSESPALDEIHRGKILAHHAKAGYDYPTIHLPVAFSGLIGLPTRIYQTVQNGALAFLVVVSSTSKSSRDTHANTRSGAKSIAFTRRRSGVRIASSPPVFFDSEAGIVSDDEDGKEEKLPTNSRSINN